MNFYKNLIDAKKKKRKKSVRKIDWLSQCEI